MLFSLFSFSQTELEAGDLAIIGLDTGDEDFMFVTFQDLEIGTTIYFTDEEASGDFTIGTGEGTLVFVADAPIVAGTVITRLNNASLFTVTSDGNISLANSGDGLLAYQGTSVGAVTTFLHAVGKELSHIGTFPNDFSNYFILGSDDAAYDGTRTGADADGYFSLIHSIENWTTSGSGVTFDTSNFDIGTSEEPSENCGTESFLNSNATASYSDNSFEGDNGISWTYKESRNANNDANNSGINLPALMLRGSSYGSKLASTAVSGGIKDFSVKLYKGFTGSGNRQVELFVNGVSFGLSEAFDDTDEHIFTVSNINISGNVTVEIQAATNKQVIVDDINWTCYSAAVPQISLSGNTIPIASNSTATSVEDGTDLGAILVGNTTSQVFQISNAGTEILHIASIVLDEDSSEAFSLTIPETLSLQPNETTTFAVNFEPESEGIASASVQLMTNDPVTNPFQFTVQGEGIGSCEAPTSQVSNALIGTITGNAASGTLTAITADGYLVLVSTLENLTTLPEDGTVYSPNTILGEATVVQSSESTLFTIPNLNANTVYQLFILPYNHAMCFGGPAYATEAPLHIAFTTGAAACLEDDFNTDYGNWEGTGTYLNGNAGVVGDGVGFNAEGDVLLTDTAIENPDVVSFYLARSSSEAAKTLTLFYSSDAENWFTIESFTTEEISEDFELFFISANLSGSYYLKLEMTEREGGSLYVDELDIFCSTAAITPEIAVLGNGVEILDGTTETTEATGTFLGTAAVNEQLTQSYEIQNTGDDALLISEITFIDGSQGFQTAVDYSDTTIAAGASLTVTIYFENANAGDFTDQLVIHSNDADESEFTFQLAATVYLPQPELVVRGVIGSNPTISNGSTNAIATNNTLFPETLLGETITKTFRIANEGGTAALQITSAAVTDETGQFAIDMEENAVIDIDTYIDFTITFQPQYAGTQTATVTIGSNDIDANPYTFVIEGKGVCTTSEGTVWPSEGPANTVVRITSGEYIADAMVYLNSVGLDVISTSDHELKVVVAETAESGNMIVELANGCSFSTSFTVLNSIVSGCEYDSTATVSDIFISEVTDAPFGSLTYVELYNATGSAIDFSSTNYRLRFYSNGNETSSYGLWLTEGIIAENETFVVAIGAPEDAVESQCAISGGMYNDLYADLVNTTLGGINFTENGDDCIGLYDASGTLVDVFGVYQNATWADTLGIGDRGANFQRNYQATVPSTTFALTDWAVVDWNDDNCDNVDYSTIGWYDFSLGTAPVIIAHPEFINECQASVTLTVSASEAYESGAGLSYHWYMLHSGTTTWEAITDNELFSGAQTNALMVHDVLNVDGYQLYATVQEGDNCKRYSQATAIELPKTVWDGSNWSNGVPNGLTSAWISGSLPSEAIDALDVCNLIITSGAQLTVPNDGVLKVMNKVVNTGEASDITIESGGSLLQTNATAVNEGMVTVQRTATVQPYDYVYWSAAVADFAVTSLSPSTPASAIWQWLPTQTTPDYGTWISAGGNMIPGKGYAIRVPNITTETFTATKVGIPLNGTVNTPVARGNYSGSDYMSAYGSWVNANDDNWNLIGNPYPSALNLNTFFAQNINVEGVAYIWTHGSGLSLENENPFYSGYMYNYDAADYLVHNQTGSSIPGVFDGNIATGQGFFVLLKDSAPVNDTIVFTNAMRNETFDNDQFFRVVDLDTIVQGKIWLQLAQNTDVVTCLVGYVPGATNNWDGNYDALVNTSGNALYSIVDSQNLVIQGRGLPFQNTDVVPLGVKVTQPGSYAIGIEALEGIFTDASQEIYLNDLDLNVIHNLKTSPYNFTMNFPGIENNRFQLQFVSGALNTTSFDDTNKVRVVKVGEGHQAISDRVMMEKLQLFDISGKVVWQSESLESLQYTLPGQLASGSYVLAVQLVGGQQQFVTFQYE
ncbi:choice-of-anchor D domain-containing protein [Pustulibacterium marinum]|nr:choice-of-anchor D domain-containing protein [Pustulibacterium marinum]